MVRKSTFFMAFVSLLLTAQSINSIAQTVTTVQGIVVNGGVYEYENPTDWVSIQYVSPETLDAVVFDTIYNQSVQSVEVLGNSAYVGAEDSLVCYNLESYERIASSAVGVGISDVVVSEDYLIVTRQYPVTANFVQVYNPTTLEEIQNIDAVSGECGDGLIIDNTAYVLVNYGWSGTSTSIAIIDLENFTVEEIDLGAQAAGAATLFEEDGKLFIACNTPYGGSSGSITIFDTETNEFEIVVVDGQVNNAYGFTRNSQEEPLLIFVLDNNLCGMDIESYEHEIIAYNPSATGLESICSAGVDVVSGNIWYCITDYVSVGQGYVVDNEGTPLGMFPTGISPECFSFEYFDETAVDEAHWVSSVEVAPNPCKNFITIDVKQGAEITIFDTKGRVVFYSKSFNNQTIATAHFAPGIYILIEREGASIATSKFVKQ